MKILYVSQEFPSLTETFVSREVEELIKLGTDVSVVSFKKPDIDKIHRRFLDFQKNVRYLPETKDIRLYLPLFLWFFRKPFVFTKLLILLFSEKGNFSGIERLTHSAIEFVRGIYLASVCKKEIVPDHLHSTFSTERMTSTYVASILTNIPYSFADHSSFQAKILERKINDAKFVVAISSYTKYHQLIKGRNIADHEKIKIIHCGVDVDDWISRTDMEEEGLIVSVGSLGEIKGHEYLIKACRLLADKKVDFRCVIVGEGSQREFLEKLIQENSLEKRVVLTGRMDTDDVKSLMQKCSVFALTCIVTDNGDRDGIPVVLMEAMALGKACISTELSGIPELIESGKCGILVEPRDVEAIASSLIKLLKNKKIRNTLGAAAREKVEKEFNLQTNIKKLSQLFSNFADKS